MIQGFDTSSLAGNKLINFAQVKASGFSFGFHRASSGYKIDSAFKRVWEGMGEYAITRGVYTLYYVGLDINRQVDTFCAAVTAAGGINQDDFVPVLDVEGTQLKSKPLPAVIKGLLAMREGICKMIGCPRVLIYSSNRVWIEYLKNTDVPELADDFFWAVWCKTGAVPVAKPWRSTAADAIQNGNYWVQQRFVNRDAPSASPGFKSGVVDVDYFSPMCKGEMGRRVRVIQTILKRIVNSSLVVDGKFGLQTEQAVGGFQSHNGLVLDCIVGPKTLAMLSWA